MSANPTVPFWTNPLKLDILEPCLLKPLYVLFLLWEEHPRICKEARQPEGWIHGTNQARLSPKSQNPVRFPDSTLWVWPVLNTETTKNPSNINRIPKKISLNRINQYLNSLSLSICQQFGIYPKFLTPFPPFTSKHYHEITNGSSFTPSPH